MSNEYDTLIRYYMMDSNDGTDHLVREERDNEVVTACGLTLRKKGPTSLSWTSGGYVRPVAEAAERNRCGNCPWDEVDA